MIAVTLCTGVQSPHPLRLAMLSADEVRKHLREYADTTDRSAWEAEQAAGLLDKAATR